MNLEMVRRTFAVLYPELQNEALFQVPGASASISPHPSTQSLCTLCPLHLGRTKSVESRGSKNARVVFLGDFPSDEDDAAGKPFSGNTGQLLDKMIAAMGLSSDDVFLTTLTKCRPPRTHVPTEEEILTCRVHLDKQMRELPRLGWIVALGEVAAQTVASARGTVSQLRKERHSYRGVPAFVTYHPRSVLEDSNLKRPTWEDLKAVMGAVGGRS